MPGRINDEMGAYVARKMVKAMLRRRIHVDGARVLNFKENHVLYDLKHVLPASVSDLRL